MYYDSFTVDIEMLDEWGVDTKTFLWQWLNYFSSRMLAPFNRKQSFLSESCSAAKIEDRYDVCLLTGNYLFVPNNLFVLWIINVYTGTFKMDIYICIAIMYFSTVCT